MTAARHGAAASSLRPFLTLWVGQVVSLTGSGLTTFALGIWVFRTTRSVTLFALISLFSTLPGLLLSPFAGTLIDRWDRRRILILSDAVAALAPLLVAVLNLTGALEIWHIYVATMLTSVAAGFQVPAYGAATSLLVGKDQIGRAAGLNQLAQAIAHIGGPVLAAWLMSQVTIEDIFLVDVASFVFSIATLLAVTIPSPPAVVRAGGWAGFWRDTVYGWRYLVDRPGLLGLLLFFAIINFQIGIVLALYTPMVLGFASVRQLGLLQSTLGIGMLVGGIAITVLGSRHHRVLMMLGFELVMGLGMLLSGLRPSLALVTVAACLCAFAAPMVIGSSQAIWQTKVAPEVQGRVFALRRMIGWSSLPIAYAAAGPLADVIFEPVMLPGGLLAGSLGPILGVGPGRGIGLLFVVLGAVTAVVTVFGYANPRLRNVERDLPDVLPSAGAVSKPSVPEPAVSARRAE